jgi:hypothetical protein
MTDKIVYVYNKYLFELIDTLPEFLIHKAACKVKNLQSIKYITLFSSQLSPDLRKKILESTPEKVCSIVGQSIKLISELTIGDIGEAVPDSKVAAYYLYILVLYSDLWKMEDEEDRDALFDTYTKAISTIQKDELLDLEGIYDTNIKKLLQQIELVSSALADTPTHQEATDTFDPTEMLQNTKIGALAQEIAKEVDVSQINVDKPEDLLNPTNLFSGNSPLGDIIGKVGTKIHEKISNGELRHDELMTEAFNMLKMFNGGGASGLNPLMNDLMKNMASGKAKVNTSSLTKMATRDRLRSKLEDRKRL